MKCVITCDVPMRAKAGEIGEVLENDSNKYAYKVELPGTFEFMYRQHPRIFYFYDHEVRLMPEAVKV